MAQDKRRIFLLDAFGALLSAFLLGVVLVQFESSFGMPSQVLCYLASVACVFAVYSFSCHFRILENWKPFLKVIAFANLIYCCVTIVLVFYFYQQLTTLGLVYFLLEHLVVFSIIALEFKIAYSSSSETAES